MFRTAFLILSGNATASLLLLVRNLIVARLISVEDYGVAATFAVVMAMVEMTSAFGLQQQIVQSRDGDKPRFQAALQGFQVLRGVATGLLMFLIAIPIAKFLNIPEAIWAYQLLALVPVIKAFEHFDIHRLNRQMRFWPLILTGGVPAFLSLVLVWPLASWLGDWRVMLYAILAQICVRTLTSHLVAERSYWITFDRIIMGQSVRFGWPILVNAVLMFFVFQGDKLIVGRVLGMEVLAIFAMGMTLTLTPTLVVQASAQKLFLPILAKIDRSTAKGEAKFQYLAMVASELHMLFGASFVCFIAVFGQPIVTLLLGSKFQDLVPVLTLFAVLQCLRVIKGGSSTVALSDGRTENAMIANITRVALLPIGYIIAVQAGSVEFVIAIAILGEASGFIISLLLLKLRSKVKINSLIFPSSGVFLLCSIMIFINNNYSSIITLIISIFLLGLIFLKLENLRAYLFRGRWVR